MSKEFFEESKKGRKKVPFTLESKGEPFIEGEVITTVPTGEEGEQILRKTLEEQSVILTEAQQKSLAKMEAEGNNLHWKAGNRKMTVPERNMLMKIDFVNAGLTVKAIAEKYDVSESVVWKEHRKGKWSAARKAYRQAVDDAVSGKIIEAYAQCGTEVNMQYNNAWQKMLDACMTYLNDLETHGMSADGKLKLGGIHLVAEILEKAQKGHYTTAGILGREAAEGLQLRKEELALKKRMAGEEEEAELVQDNFVEALQGINQTIWEDEEDEENQSEDE